MPRWRFKPKAPTATAGALGLWASSPVNIVLSIVADWASATMGIHPSQ